MCRLQNADFRSDGKIRLWIFKRKWEDNIRSGSSKGYEAEAEIIWLRIGPSSKTRSCDYDQEALCSIKRRGVWS
jgi:hypothetical protein